MSTNFNGHRTARGIGALLLCSFMLVAGSGARASSGGSAAGLDGRWYHDGKPTRILVAPDGRSITIINELGQRNDGYASGPRNLVIPSLGVTGEVNRNGRRIRWTNGTEWTRDSNNPGPAPAVNLSGRWFRNGQATTIDVARDGRNFSITNEWGLRSTGFVSRSGELKVPGWHVTGHLSRNGQRISWSNGTEWTRPRLY